MTNFPLVGFAKQEVGEKKLDTCPDLVKVFGEVVDNFTAGDPQSSEVKWTGLQPSQLQTKLKDRNYQVSFYLINELLRKAGLRRRSYLKAASLDQVPQRNDQFEKIAHLKAHFLDAGLPVLSIDTKKKELLGNFHRKGQYYDSTFRKVNDHDFKTFATGQVIPHGLYDLADNMGYLSLGTSKDTSEFVCDNLEAFWSSDLQWKYPTADWLLLLCDGGGSNNSRHYIVKQDLYHLAQRIDMNILIAHYPPYCSKWNPIEHRFFCHLHRAWEGTIFHSIQTVKELAMMTQTKTGLGIKVRINQKQYQSKREVNYHFKENIEQFVSFDQDLPKWNYFIKTPNRKVIF